MLYAWIHAERVANRLIPLNEQHKSAVNWARDEIWTIYASLKTYKLKPTGEQADIIRQNFQALCTTKTSYATER